MAEIEITDEASLEAWLNTRPGRDAEIVAFRAAARVFPLWGRAMEEDWAAAHSFSALICFRAMVQKAVLQRTSLFADSLIASAAETAHEAMKSAPSIRQEIVADCAAYACRAIASACEKQSSDVNFKSSLVQQTMVDALDAVSMDGSAASEVELWKALEQDARALLSSRTLAPTPLWPTPAPDWFTTADRETRAIWAKDPATWAFWEKWWDGVISGEMPFSPDLLRDVALIDDDIWQAGPREVAEAIARIEAAHRPHPMTVITADQALDRALAKLPPAKDTAIAAVREAVIANRADLLENFDALQGFIALEIKRLQKLNYMSDEHRDLCIQQMKTLSVIGLTVERLSALVPKQAGVAPDAVKIESLGRVYINLFQEWPRSNAREVVDTTCRLSIVGIGSVVAAGVGLPVAAISAVLTGAYLAQPLVKVVVDGGKRKKK